MFCPINTTNRYDRDVTMDIDQQLCPWFYLLFENHKLIFYDHTSDINCSNLCMDSLNKSDEVMIMYIYEIKFLSSKSNFYTHRNLLNVNLMWKVHKTSKIECVFSIRSELAVKNYLNLLCLNLKLVKT